MSDDTLPVSAAGWAQRRASGCKPQGAAGHLSPEQKQQIRLAYLESAGDVTYVALAKQFGVNRDTVSACLKGPEYDKLRAALDAELRMAAIQRLKAHVLPATDAWGRAIETAADKGDHKPARDLLLHTGTIEPVQDRRDSGITIIIGGDAQVLLAEPRQD